MPTEMMETGHYNASLTTEDVWICYPWEAKYVIELIIQRYLLISIANMLSGISMSMIGCQRRTLSHEFEFCTECSCSHSHAPDVRICSLYTKVHSNAYLCFMLKGKLPTLAKRERTRSKESLFSIHLDPESAMDD